MTAMNLRVWSADVLELAGIELDSLKAQQLRYHDSANDITNYSAILGCPVVNVARGNQAASAKHVYYDDARLAGMCLPRWRPMVRV